MAAPKRILIAEEHEMMRELLSRLLGSGNDGLVVSGVGTIREALALAPTLAPELAIVDWQLPDGFGSELVRELRTASPGTRSLIVSDDERLHLVRDSLRAGATGVVMKSSSTDTLRAAVTAVADGHCYFCPTSLRLLVDVVRSDNHPPLTASELAVLRAVARGANATAIAAHRRLRPKTVRNQLSKLKAKLGIRETAGLVRYAIQQGLVELS